VVENIRQMDGVAAGSFLVGRLICGLAVIVKFRYKVKTAF